MRASKSLLLILALTELPADTLSAQSPSQSATIAAAVVPLPAGLQAGAGVVTLDAAAKPHTLRASANGMVCIADDPGDASFVVECYHASFIPVVYRIKQLVAQRVPEAILDKTIEAEIRSGSLKLPTTATTGYLAYGPIGGYDASTDTVGDAIEVGRRLYMPYATPGAAGVSSENDGMHPYMMAAGTYYAHVMLPEPAFAPQTVADTLPERVVARMLDLFDRGEVRARSELYDSVYYFQDLMVPPPGHADRPRAVAPEERARGWSEQIAKLDTGLPRHRKVLERMVAGRFVVYRIAVLFDPPNEDRSFEKLEVYEVKNGKIVAEYDGQFVASGRTVAAKGP